MVMSNIKPGLWMRTHTSFLIPTHASAATLTETGNWEGLCSILVICPPILFHLFVYLRFDRACGLSKQRLAPYVNSLDSWNPPYANSSRPPISVSCSSTCISDVDSPSTKSWIWTAASTFGSSILPAVEVFELAI
jgi:hypothetical protein